MFAKRWISVYLKIKIFLAILLISGKSIKILKKVEKNCIREYYDNWWLVTFRQFKNWINWISFSLFPKYSKVFKKFGWLDPKVTKKLENCWEATLFYFQNVSNKITYIWSVSYLSCHLKENIFFNVENYQCPVIWLWKGTIPNRLENSKSSKFHSAYLKV